MGKKSELVSSALENLETTVERQVLFSVSDLLRNVSHLAGIFFPSFNQQHESAGGYYGGGGGGVENLTNSVVFSNESDSYFYSNNNNNFLNSNNSEDETESEPGVLLSGLYGKVLSETVECILFLTILWTLNRVWFKSKYLDFVPKFVASWMISLALLPGIVLGLSAVLVARFGTGLYLRLRFGKGRVFLAAPMDAPWAFERPASPSTCTGLYVVRGKCDFQKVLRRIERCMEVETGEGKLIFERLRYALRRQFGFVCWERLSDFDMRRQVKLLSEKRPELEGRALTETEVLREMSKMHDEPLTVDSAVTAPWEMLVVPKYVVEGKEGAEHYALVFRIHHALMDGVSMGNALHSGIADKPFKFTLDPIQPLKISKLQLWTARVLALVMMPYVTLKNLSLTERHRFHGPALTGSKYLGWTRAVKLSALKGIKNKTKTSVFSILMTCIAGAFRNLFIQKGEPVPDVIHAAPPIAILPFPDRVLRNRFAIVIFPLQLGVQSVVKRLERVYRAAQDLAHSSDILANFFTMNILGLLPLFAIQFLGSFAHATMTLSNIPGPAELVTMFEGDALVDVGAWVPVKNTIGIGMALFSYANRMRVTIIADEACLDGSSDLDFLKQEFEEQLKELAKHVGVQESVFCDSP